MENMFHKHIEALQMYKTLAALGEAIVKSQNASKVIDAKTYLLSHRCK
jgi:hypothetical protein